MIAIPLTQNKTAIIDDQDVEIMRWRWSYLPNGRAGYAVRRESIAGERRTVYMHRQIMSAAPGEIVDHADGDGLNNTRSNLRLCDGSQNGANRPTIARAIPFRGVYLDRRRDSIYAAIKFQQCAIRLGSFQWSAIERAARTYDRAAIHLFGSFARLNFQDTAPTLAMPVPAALERRQAQQLCMDLVELGELDELPELMPVSGEIRQEYRIQAAWRRARVAPAGDLCRIDELI